jgi:DNA repair protein RecO (recombination protein O)
VHWIDNSLILSAKKYGENSALLRVLSREHGVFGGVMRGVYSNSTAAKTNRGIIQAGNIVNATWNARLSEQLGTLKCELLHANAAQIMHDSAKLNALTCACTLLEAALPERHPYPHLYDVFSDFMAQLIHHKAWAESYVRFEIELLADTGFGLDLTHCAATDTTEDLIYVSPKSGRAVCRQAGKPYKDKLLRLPTFLIGSPRETDNMQEILDGLELTGYFLAHWLLAPHNRKLPAVRGRLIESINTHTKMTTHENI